jgi:hypothetical protein
MSQLDLFLTKDVWYRADYLSSDGMTRMALTFAIQCQPGDEWSVGEAMARRHALDRVLSGSMILLSVAQCDPPFPSLP